MANKPVLIAAAVVLVLSLGSLAVAGAAISSVEDDFQNITPYSYLSETSTSHEIKYVDDDGLGSAGFYILIEGETTDEDQDGLVDACVDFEFTVMDGSTDVTEQTSEVDCTRDGATQLDGEFPDEGFIDLRMRLRHVASFCMISVISSTASRASSSVTGASMSANMPAHAAPTVHAVHMSGAAVQTRVIVPCVCAGGQVFGLVLGRVLGRVHHLCQQDPVLGIRPLHVDVFRLVV